MTVNYYVTNFYRFLPIPDVGFSQAQLEAWQAAHTPSRGLIILAPEGLNGTMEFTSTQARDEFKSWLINTFGLVISDFKDSLSGKPLFRHFKVKLRSEIVTLTTPELVPTGLDESHLSPTEWRKMLTSGQKVNLVDTRNTYEVKIGQFEGAMNPEIEQFTELPEALEAKGVAKDEPLMMYCTGGIRCEKAVLEMRRRGFSQVYQLHGGILKYLEEYPNDLFKGECFVFDDRVAVTQELAPTQSYGLCPHCSDPAAQKITCKRCGGEARICDDCLKLEVEGSTCSRECQHHYRLKPWQKAKRPFIHPLAELERAKSDKVRRAD